MSLRSNKTIDIAFILREKKIKTISATLVQCIKYLEKQYGRTLQEIEPYEIRVGVESFLTTTNVEKINTNNEKE